MNKSQYGKIVKDFSKTAPHKNFANIAVMRKHVGTMIKNKKILDIGCGVGDDILFYQSNGADAKGIDISTEVVAFAKEKGVDSIVLGDFIKTDFSNNEFDIVTAKYSIQHEMHIDRVYREVFRILKVGGEFVFLVTHPLRQFFEKKCKNADYFRQAIIDCHFFNETFLAREHSHTFNDYLSSYFLSHFDIIAFEEAHDPSAEKIGDSQYPGFFLIKAVKKDTDL